ncbi:MAG: four helix bundle protein [Verrucomicrobia bacterium]|nr:MAG: four helix bundle protein [Verrucomicrobiota bacterium]
MSKNYDLEERTYEFAKAVRTFVRMVLKDIPNIEDCKQVVRSSGSVAANYIEANESLSKKDFLMRAKICRKEAKESKLWLRLIMDEKLESDCAKLEQEAHELTCIFGAIITKTSG